jgi:DcuC family C4-dicarboxylate transporter
VIGGTVKAAAFGMSPTYLATVLAVCWAIGLSVSPSSATIITTSSLTGQSPMKVGARWNGTYAIASAGALILMLTLLRMTGAL